MVSDIDYTAMGTRIRELRERKGWTQETLAVKADFDSQSYISGVESGAEHLGLPGAQAVAMALGVPVDYLLSGEIASLESNMQEKLNEGNSHQKAMMIEMFFANAEIILKYNME